VERRVSPEHPSRSQRPADGDPAHSRLEEVVRIVDSALTAFEAPPGWRVLRSSGRLEARWSGEEGRWAQFSVRLNADPAPRRTGTLFFRRPVGHGHLTVVFDSCDLGEDVVLAACELMTPLQRMLAQAAAR
jgi:hypothetical protein